MTALIASATFVFAQSHSETVPFKAELNKLSNYLRLKSSQKDIVYDLNENFILKQRACDTDNPVGKQKMQQILIENLSEMKKVLTKLQFEKYIKLLDITNKNSNVIDEESFASLVEQAGKI
jgi:hypothetical protein